MNKPDFETLIETSKANAIKIWRGSNTILAVHCAEEDGDMTFP